MFVAKIDVIKNVWNMHKRIETAAIIGNKTKIKFKFTAYSLNYKKVILMLFAFAYFASRLYISSRIIWRTN